MGVRHPSAFGPERGRRQADHDASRGLGEFRDVGCDPGPGTAAEPDRDEGEVRIANLVPEFLLRDLGAPLADLRPSTGSHAARHAPAYKKFPVRFAGSE